MGSPIVFISYSHRDERWMKRLVTHLGAVVREDQLLVWSDQCIRGGDDWRPAIMKAMRKASIAVLLVSADFLNSAFIREREIAVLLRRRADEGLKVFPVLVRDCLWQKVTWLEGLQLRPKDGMAIAQQIARRHEALLTEIATEICSLLPCSG